MKSIRIPLLLAASAAFGTTLPALTLQIDFSRDNADPGGHWTTISQGLVNRSGIYVDLPDFDTGEATSIDFAGSADSIGHGFPGWQGGDVGWIDADAASDYISSDSSLVLTLSGVPAGTYSLELVSAAEPIGGPPYPSIYANGALADRTALGAGTSAQWDFNTGYENADWLIWDNLTPVDDQIQITFSGSGDALVNALRLTSVASAVPEPATCALFASLAALAWAGCHRRRRRHLVNC